MDLITLGLSTLLMITLFIITELVVKVRDLKTEAQSYKRTIKELRVDEVILQSRIDPDLIIKYDLKNKVVEILKGNVDPQDIRVIYSTMVTHWKTQPGLEVEMFPMQATDQADWKIINGWGFIYKKDRLYESRPKVREL